MMPGAFSSVSSATSPGEPALARPFEVAAPAPSLAARIADGLHSLVLWFHSVLAEAEELERQGVWPPSNGLSDWEVIVGVQAIFAATRSEGE